MWIGFAAPSDARRSRIASCVAASRSSDFERQQPRRRGAVPRQTQADDPIAARRQRAGRCCAGCTANPSDRAAAARRRRASPAGCRTNVRFQLKDQTFGSLRLPGLNRLYGDRSASSRCPAMSVRTWSRSSRSRARYCASVVTRPVGVVGCGEFGRQSHAVPGLQLGPGPQEMQVNPDADEQQCRQQRAHRTAQPA